MTTQQTGKIAEAYAWMKLLEHGMMPYLPMVDVSGVDVLVETRNGQFAKLQIKSRGSSVPDKGQGSYGEQIKGLWWEQNKLAFDYLVIVLPKAESPHIDYETWIVPKTAVQRRLKPGGRGDLTMSVRLMREEWKEYHEKWDIISQNQVSAQK